MNRPSLYHLSEAFTALAARLDDAEVPDDIAAEIDALQLDLPSRVADCVEYRDRLRDEAESLRGRAAKFIDLARKREAVADTLAADVVRVMDAAGVDSLPTPAGKVRVQRASRPAIRWEGDAADVPEAFRKVTVSLDGQAAYEAFRAGTLPAGFVTSFTRSLRVT